MMHFIVNIISSHSFTAASWSEAETKAQGFKVGDEDAVELVCEETGEETQIE